MVTVTASPQLHFHQEPDYCNEVPTKHTMVLSDNLKDLRSLRKQLYCAAEYFELSYTNDDHKQVVADTLKDYAVKAFVNTVDHLGSATYKVNDMLDERVGEVSGAELRVSCIEQRLQACQIHIGREGISQHSLVINAPKYHKQYISEVGDAKPSAIGTKPKHKEHNVDDEHDLRPLRNADWFCKGFQAAIKETSLPTAVKERSPSPAPQPYLHSRSSSFTGFMRKKEREKRAASPHQFSCSLLGSLSSETTTPKSLRPTTPNSSRSTTPNAYNGTRLYQSKLERSASMRLHGERQIPKEVEQQPSKGKRLLKALLSRKKSEKDDMLYTYLDEY